MVLTTLAARVVGPTCRRYVVALLARSTRGSWPAGWSCRSTRRASSRRLGGSPLEPGMFANQNTACRLQG